ncbi:MAG: glycosyltransferase family 2 protein [Myxococcota bacterium]
MANARPDNPLISIVVPVLDEEGCVEELVSRVGDALASENVRYEILFVDDGSSDGTWARLTALHAGDPAVKAIRFTRSFGHQAALIAGLHHAKGDAVVTMDGDLQHPPEFLPTLIKAWREGVDVVNSVRQPPPGSSGGAKEGVSQLFYGVMRALTAVDVTPAAADFRLMDRKAVDAFNSFEERFVFMRGLVPWLGFSEAHFDYEVGTRFAGRSKYGVWRMFRLAVDGVLSFSVVPLRLIAILGLLTTLFGIGFGLFALVSYAMGRVGGAGWTSVVVLILVFGGVQLLSLGIVSEYIGRTYEEVKGRPRYVIETDTGIE